jgi:hypothetical protein
MKIGKRAPCQYSTWNLLIRHLEEARGVYRSFKLFVSSLESIYCLCTANTGALEPKEKRSKRDRERGRVEEAGNKEAATKSRGEARGGRTERSGSMRHQSSMHDIERSERSTHSSLLQIDLSKNENR